MKALLIFSMLAVWLQVSGQETGKAETYQSPLYNKIESIALSPDRKTLVAADSAGHVFYWGRDGGLRKILRANVLPVTDIAISSDEKFFATTSSDNQVIIWNFSGEKVDYAAIGSPLITLAFAPSGDSLFYATRNGIFKGSVRNLPNSVKINDAYVICGDESDDNSFIVLGSAGMLRIFSLKDGKPVAEIASCDGVRKVEFKGNLISALCDDGTIQLFEFSGQNLKQVASCKTDISDARMIITDDNRILVMGTNKTIMWNPGTGKFFNVNGFPEGMTAFAYSDNGNLYAGNNKGQIMSWKATSGSEIHKYQPLMNKPESKPEFKIETTRTGIPVSINKRTVQAGHSVEVSSSSLDIYVWDDEREDGDTISLYLNGEWILSNYMITGEKKRLTARLASDKPNYLVLYAHNLGKLPPNTAVVSFHDGKEERMLTVESDLKRCGAVTFTLKK